MFLSAKKKLPILMQTTKLKSYTPATYRFHTTLLLTLPKPVSLKFSFQNVNLGNEILNFIYNRPFINTLYAWDSQPY